MTINKAMSLATRDFADAVRWASKTSGGQIRFDIGKDDTVMYLSSFQDTSSSRVRIDMTLTSGNPGDRTFVVSSGMLVNALKLIKGNEFTATLSSSTFTVKSGRSTVNFPIIKGGDEILVPPLPPLAGRVDTQDLKHAVNNALLAVASDDSAVILMAVHCLFSPKNGKITFVATDRYIVVVRTISYIPADDTVEDYSKNVRGGSLKTLVSGLQNPDSTVDLHLTPDGAQFVIRDVNYMAGIGVVGGEYIKYEGFTKLVTKGKVRFELAELKGAIDGIAMLLTPEEPIILTITNDECIVSAAGNLGSTGCAAEADLGDPDDDGVEATLKVAFSAKNIKPALNAVSGKFIELRYAEVNKPWIVKEFDEKGDELSENVTITMPVRLSSIVA